MPPATPPPIHAPAHRGTKVWYQPGDLLCSLGAWTEPVSERRDFLERTGLILSGVFIRRPPCRQAPHKQTWPKQDASLSGEQLGFLSFPE